MTPGPPKLARKQEAFVAAMLTAHSIEDAAREAGISKSTAVRWLKDGEIAEQYRQARREVMTQAVASLQSAAGQAVTALLELLHSPVHMAKLGAARAILEFALHGTEVEDVGARLEQVEAALADREAMTDA